MSSAKKKKQMPKIGNIGRKVIGRPFVKGGPGTGRQPGQVNKFTSLKASFLEVFEQLDSTAGFLAWAKASPRNRAMFYGWLARMLPGDINVSNSSESQEAINDQLKRIADSMMLPDPTPDEWRVFCRECRAHNGPERIDTHGPLDGVPRSYEQMRNLSKMITPEAENRLLARAKAEDAEKAADDEKAKAGVANAEK